MVGAIPLFLCYTTGTHKKEYLVEIILAYAAFSITLVALAIRYINPGV